MKFICAFSLALFSFSFAFSQVNLTEVKKEESDSIYFKDGKALGGKTALVELCAAELEKEKESGITVEGHGACSCMYETMGKYYTYKQFMESMGKDGKDIFTKAAKKDSPAYTEMLQCVISNMKGAGKKSGVSSKEDVPAPAATESGSIYNKEFKKSFMESCEKSARENKKMKKSGLDASAYCQCTLDKIIEKNLSMSQLGELGNTESPLFNEIIVPCVTEALGTK